MGFFSDEELVEQPVGNEVNKEETSIDGLDKEAKEPIKAQETPKPVDNVPAKYRGKSIEEVIRMHTEAEKLMNKHAEEVGFARRMAEQATQMLQQSDKSSQTKRTDADSDDSNVEFFADPRNTVKKVVDNHPDIVAAREFTLEQRKKEAFNIVKDKVGDPSQYFNDPDFVNWLEENPFRKQSLIHANQNTDPHAAIEVLTNFKNYKQYKNQELKGQQDTIKAQTDTARKAGMVDGGGPGETSSATIYRRADLISLQNRDPDRYERLQPQIVKAYAEGRVR